MGSWDRVNREISALERPDAIDEIRRRKMERVQEITGRALVVYATDFASINRIKAELSGAATLISLTDKDGFDEVTQNLDGSELDILLHSPGGSAEATEAIVDMLRARFTSIRFIIPSIAKSAATMLAMSGDQILMDDRSELGPIDPQMGVIRDGSLVYAPAQAVKDQFDSAQQEVNNDPNKLPAWIPILRQYAPSLLAECDHHLKLAEELVSMWLQQYMFAGHPNAEQRAKAVAAYLNDHRYFHSHGRRVGITELEKLDVNVLDMRTDLVLREAIRELYVAIRITFERSGVFKLFENHKHEILAQFIELTPIAVQETPHPQEKTRQKGRRVK